MAVNQLDTQHQLSVEQRLAANQRAKAERLPIAIGAQQSFERETELMSLIAEHAFKTAKWQAENRAPTPPLNDGLNDEEQEVAVERSLRQWVGQYLDAKLPTDVKLMAALSKWHKPLKEFQADLLHWVCGYGYIDILAHEPGIEDIHIHGRRSAFVKASSGYRDLPPIRDKWLFNHFVEQVTRHMRPKLSELNALPPTFRLPGRVLRLRVVHPSIGAGEFGLDVRFLREKVLNLGDLVASGLLTRDAAIFVRDVYLAGGSILVVGATGAGKSTLTYALSELVDYEYMVIIANPREIVHTNRHHYVMDVRDAVGEGGRVIGVADLVVAALTMTPDRLFLTEARGPEMLPLLTALSTGHGGSLTTMHADSLRDAFRVRIPRMVRAHEEGRGLTNSDIASSICSAFDLGIFIRKVALPDRRVARQIIEISLIHPPMEDHNGTLQVTTSEVFKRNTAGELVFVGGGTYPEKLLNRSLTSGRELPDLSALARKHADVVAVSDDGRHALGARRAA